MATIADYQKAYNNAKARNDKAGMDAAHAGAEKIRASQGFSGGVDGSKRISLASTVPDQVYAGGNISPGNLMEGGGTPGVSYPYNPIIPTEPNDPTSDYLKELADAQRRSRIAKLDQAKAAALSALDTEQANLDPMYYGKRNEAAATSEVGAMNFAQYMASRGIKGNAGAMPEIYRQAGLQGQIGALDQAQARDMSDIERQRGLIGTNYAFDVAQANADVDSQSMQMLIDQYNRNREYKLQQAQLTGTYNGAPTMDRQRMETEATGYYNPWAGYALNDDVNSQLAPYMGNLQAFIDENPTSPLYEYAQNARFQKIASDPTLRDKYGSQYQTVQGMSSALNNKARELEIAALQIQNSALPETVKLEVEKLRQQVKDGNLDYDKALAEIDQIKKQTANIGASTALGWAELDARNRQNASESANESYNDAIGQIDSLYVYNDPVTGVPTVNKTGLRPYILSLNLSDDQTAKLLTRYGV
jgi:hypothetical protein